MNKKQKRAALALSVLLLGGAAVGGTYALLKHETGVTTNTFTAQSKLFDPTNPNQEFKLLETLAVSNGNGTYSLSTDPDQEKVMTNTYSDLVSGVDIPKDPEVTLKNISGDFWLFLEVDNTLTGGMAATIDTTEWTKLDDPAGKVKNVYYKAITAAETKDKVKTVNILLDDKVVSVPDFTLAEGQTSLGNLNFQAYLVQKNPYDEATTTENAAALAALTAEYPTVTGTLPTVAGTPAP